MGDNTSLKSTRKITKDTRYDIDKIDRIYSESISKGIEIDIEEMERIYLELIDKSLIHAEKALIELPEKYHQTNLNSSKQVNDILIHHFGLGEFADKTKGGASFNSSVLDKIYKKTGNNFVINLKEYRTYISMTRKLDEIRDYIRHDHKVYPRYVYGETNRVTYKEPAITNLHKSCRSIIKAGKGRKIIKADYKAQEVYIQINMLDIPELKKVFEESDDFYTGMYKELTGETFKGNRESLKTAWLAGIYNSNLEGVGEDKEIIGIIKKKVHSIPQVEKFRKHISTEISKGNRQIESYFGTTRDLTSDITSKHVLQNKAFNNTFQITGTDILFLALENCYSVIKSMEEDNIIKEDDIRIYMTVHDEIIFNVREDIVDDTIEILEAAMVLDIENWSKLKVKFEVKDTY